MPRISSSFGKSGIWALLPAVAALVVFANAVPNGFALDDIELVQNNPRIQSLTGLPGLIFEPYWPDSPESGLYRPLVIASFALNRALTGPGPAGFHAVNLLLHALVCGLAWHLARRVGTHYGTALATALLFALHPLHVEAVANIAGRAELLAAACVLAAWLCHRCALAEPEGDRSRGPAGPWIGGAGVFYLLALLSKEHTLVAPLVFLVDQRLGRGSIGASRPAAWRPYAAYAAAAALAGTLRVIALGGFRAPETTAFLDNPAAFGGTLARIGTALWVQAKYAGLLVWPRRLSSDYSFDAIPVVVGPLDPRLWGALLWAAALACIFAWAWRRSRPVAVGIATWVLFLLPTSNLFLATGTVMAERVAYLPSLGACLIAGHFLAWLASERSPMAAGPQRTALPVLVLVVLALALGIRTGLRNPAWRDNATLAIGDARNMPRSAKLQAGAGIALAAAGDAVAAERSFRQAIEIYPDYAQSRFNLGQLLLHRGDRAGAVEHLARAAAVSPDNPRPYKSLGPLLEQLGDREGALAAYAAGARLDPADLPFRFNHGRALLAAGRTTEALAVLGALAQEAPGDVSGQLARALIHESRGETSSAGDIYRAVLGRGDLSESVRRNVTRRLEASSGPR